MVSTFRAHLVAHRHTTANIGEATRIFLDAALEGSIRGAEKPGWKSTRDRLKQICTERRASNKKNTAASGIVEEIGQREQPLDNILLEIDEPKETKRVEHDEKIEAEKKLLKRE